MTKTIGIIAWGAQADVLYATPIVRHVRDKFPDAYITWLVRDKFAEVVETNPHIDKIKTFTLPEGHTNRQDAEYIMDKTIREFASRTYDRVLDLQYWPTFSNFYERPTEDFISLRARNAGLDPNDIVDRKIVMPVTSTDAVGVRKFRHAKMGKHLDKKFITVNHISYAASPVWSFQNYSDLVDILDHEYDVLSVFTGAPNEPIPEHCVDARGMPYRQWAGLIHISRLWLGLDSGAVALACAGSAPIIKLHSKDFPLAKTGIKAMGLRRESVLELYPAPSVESMAELIMENIK